jgi:hypothetical protein
VDALADVLDEPRQFRLVCRKQLTRNIVHGDAGHHLALLHLRPRRL